MTRFFALFVLIVMCLPQTSLAQGDNLSNAPATEASRNDTAAPNSFSTLAKRLMPAVVNIQVEKYIDLGVDGFGEDSPLNEFGDIFGRGGDGRRRQAGQGSGFFISANGYIVTNTHVIDGADKIEVTLSDGRKFDAELIGQDAETDIAVIKTTSADRFDFVSFGNSDDSEVGDWVVAIGNPFGFGGSVTSGIISARNRDINAGRFDNFIQTDAAINKGNSGGPLFNLQGEVIGVNTAIISNTGGSIGLGFSVPSNMAKKIARALMEEGTVKRAWLGARVQTATRELVAAYGEEADGGVILSSITKDGPADKAGLLAGDLILEFNGSNPENVRRFVATVAESPVNDPVEVTLVRDGKRMTVSVELSYQNADTDEEPTPDEQSTNEQTDGFGKLGLDVADITDGDRRRYAIPRDIEGVIVRAVESDGRSAGKLRQGDVITEIAFNVVFSLDDARETILTKIEEARSANRPLLLRINRRGLEVFLPITVQ